MMLKRCFHFTSCAYESRCELAHIDIRHGQFQPEHTGEHCHYFRPLVGPASRTGWGDGPDKDTE